MTELNEFTIIKGTSKRIVDYWKWAYSNINMNSERGVFAEFLIGSALDSLGTGRVEWDVADIKYRGNLIEVKSSAFLQEWEQKKPSIPIFDIAKKYEFGEYTSSRVRHAHIYIFALLYEEDRNFMDPLDMEQWEFYILSTRRINEFFGDQKSVSLNPLKKVCNPVRYKDINSVVDEIIDIQNKSD